MPQNLEQIAAPAAEDEQVAAVGIALEHFLNLECEPIHAAAHVGAAGRQPDAHATRDRNHPRTSTRSAAATVAGSGAPEMRTRPPHASSISISPDGAGTVSATEGASRARSRRRRSPTP